MFTAIKLKRSEVPGAIPSLENLQIGEVAVNISDRRIYMRDNSNRVVPISNYSVTEYEEGMWEPVLETEGGAFNNIEYVSTMTGGYFVRTENLVHVQFTLQTNIVDRTGATGNIVVSGLPYAAVPPLQSRGFSSLSVSESYGWANNPVSAVVEEGGSRIFLLKRSTIDFASSRLNTTDIVAAEAGNFVRVSGTYYSSATGNAVFSAGSRRSTFSDIIEDYKNCKISYYKDDMIGKYTCVGSDT